MRRNPNRVAQRAGLYATLILLTAVFTGPFLWLVGVSFKSEGAMVAFPVKWLPDRWDWSNFQQALTMIPYAGYARNSLTIAVISTVLTTISSAFVGFGFARLRGRGRNLLFRVLLATMMLPWVITLVPTYIIFARLHLVDTYIPWVLWGVSGSAFLIFMFRQFFVGLPTELEEAAIIDGCGYFRVFWRIFLPQAKPMIATSAILSFTHSWGDYVAPMLLLSQDKTTLAVALSTGYLDPASNPLPTVVAAGAILYILPVIVLFLVVQRAYVQGHATSGIK